MTPIPLTVLGGYLGAGKTTLLNAMLHASAGRRLAVLVNDFGNVNVDAAAVRQRDGGAIELTNGCACCAIGDDLAGALRGILARLPLPDQIVIEASGVSDPRRMAERATSADPRVGAATSIVVADASSIIERSTNPYVGEVVCRQLAAADAIVVSKLDLVDAGRRSDVRAFLGSKAPNAPTIESANDAAAVAATLLVRRAVATPRPKAEPSRSSRDAERFASLTFRSAAPIDRARFEAAARTMPNSVLRAKGHVRFGDDPELAYDFQYTDAGCAINALAAQAAPTETCVVLIGPRDRQRELQAALDALCGTAAGEAE